MKTKANKFRETIQRLNITVVIILAIGSGDGVLKAPVPHLFPLSRGCGQAGGMQQSRSGCPPATNAAELI